MFIHSCQRGVLPWNDMNTLEPDSQQALNFLIRGVGVGVRGQ